MLAAGSNGLQTPYCAWVAGISCISPWAPARLIAFGLPRDSTSTTARMSDAGTRFVLAYVCTSASSFCELIAWLPGVGSHPLPEQPDSTTAMPTMASRMIFRTTVRAFDPRRSHGLLGLMKEALALLEALEVAKQF